MEFFSKNIFSFVFIAILSLNVLLAGFMSEEGHFRGAGQFFQSVDVVIEPVSVWELSNTFIGEFGYDSKSDKLIALGEDPTHVFFFRQPSDSPEWWWEKKFENYIREQPIAFLPYGDGNLAVLSRWSDNYRLQNISTGKPLTDFFKADYTHVLGWGSSYKSVLPVALYADKITKQLRILKVFNGTASLLRDDLVPLWHSTLYEDDPSASSLIIHLDISDSRSLAWIVTTNRISCLNLADGTIIWYRDGLSPALTIQTNDWMIADFNGDNVSDIPCTFGKNETSGFVVLNGQDGSTLWELENGLSRPLVLAIADLDQDGKRDLLLGQLDISPNSEWIYVFTAQALSSKTPLWQKRFVRAGNPMVWFEFSVAEYRKKEPGLEVLFQKTNYTDTFQNNELSVAIEQHLQLVTAKSFSLLWELSWSWGPGNEDDVPDWYNYPLPDLNGDGQADILAGDEESAHLIRDGGTSTVYAEFPCLACNHRPRQLIVRGEDGPPILVMSDSSLSFNYYFYSFDGIKVPIQRSGSSKGAGSSSTMIWQFGFLFLIAIFFLRKRERNSQYE